MFSIAQEENYEVLSHFMHQGLVHRVPQHTVALHCQMHFSSQETMYIDWCWQRGCRLADPQAVPPVIMLCFWGTLNNQFFSLQEGFAKYCWYYLLWICFVFSDLFLKVSLLWSTFFSSPPEFLWLFTEQCEGNFKFACNGANSKKFDQESDWRQWEGFFLMLCLFIIYLVLIP